MDKHTGEAYLTNDEKPYIAASGKLRIAATLLDYAFSFLLTIIFYLCIGIKNLNSFENVRAFLLIIYLCWLVFPIILELLPKRQTLGKMICKIYVEFKSYDGYAIKAIVRNGAKYLFIILLNPYFILIIIEDAKNIGSWVTFFAIWWFFGFISAKVYKADLASMLASDTGSSLHDEICGTMVVQKVNLPHD